MDTNFLFRPYSFLRNHTPGGRCVAALLLAGTALCTPLQAFPSSPTPQAASPLVSAYADGWLARGRQMYDLGNYQGAADQLRAGIATEPDARLRLEGEVLLARTLLMLRSDECLPLAEAIAAREGASAAGREALLTRGDWYFFVGEYGKASLCYAEVPDIGSHPKYAYRQGVALLRCGKFVQGLRLLEPLAAGKGEYRAPAEFYVAWAHYAQGDYDAALRGFEAVESRLGKVNADSRGADDRYLPTTLEAGYYLAQMEFRRGEYQAVVNRCRNLLRQGLDDYYTAELDRLAGESLFKLNDYRGAEPYLQDYLRLVGDAGLNASSAYALGAIAYSDGRTAMARRLLEPISGVRGAVGQGASLLLGQMAAEDNDFSAAALYFESALRDGTDSSLTERAMYNHISAAAQGAATPFASATALPEQFLSRFAGSKYEPQVREYLSAAYFHDKDYARALENLDKIPQLTATQRRARQLVLFELGASEVSNGEYASAETHLRQATTGPQTDVSAQAWIWLGQALYAQGKFADSEKAYSHYLTMEPQGANAPQAVYDAAYALYMQDDFKNAAIEFTRALSLALPERLSTDAIVRLADCRYYLREYAEAARLYAEAEKKADADKPYAAMRAAMMEGLRGNLAAEIAGLQRMTATYPDSRWTPAALYELGSAQAKADDAQAAIKTYAALAQRFGQLEEGRRAQLQIANIYSRLGDDARAMEEYKTVIRRWPTGEEAKAANVELRRIMADRGELAEYAAFLNSVPGAPKVDNAELERLAYEAADNRLIANPADTAPMLSYLRQYPDGLNLAAALWRLAQAYELEGDYDKALEAISTLADKRPDASQLPEALILRGEILEAHYPTRSAEALQAYRQAERLLGAATPPELYAGIMRLTSDAAERLTYARKLRTMGGLSSEQAQEADFYEAQALAAQGDTSAATTLYRQLAAQPSSLYGARGAVALGELLIRQKNYKEAEKVLKAFTDAGTPHQYWLARGYIALADAVGSQGRKSLAREYLNALKANYPGKEADIIKAIDEGLAKFK